METFRQRLVNHRERLPAFFEHSQGQPTNNAAEQALRPSVILCQITFGNRSCAGALHHSTITSLMQTAGKQGAARVMCWESSSAINPPKRKPLSAAPPRHLLILLLSR